MITKKKKNHINKSAAMCGGRSCKYIHRIRTMDKSTLYQCLVVYIYIIESSQKNIEINVICVDVADVL